MPANQLAQRLNLTNALATSACAGALAITGVMTGCAANNATQTNQLSDGLVQKGNPFRAGASEVDPYADPFGMDDSNEAALRRARLEAQMLAQDNARLGTTTTTTTAGVHPRDNDVQSRVLIANPAKPTANAAPDIVADEPRAIEFSNIPRADDFHVTEHGATHRMDVIRQPASRREAMREHLAAIADILRQEAEESPAPATDLAKIAILEMIEPGIFHNHVADLQGRTATELLSPREISTLAPIRETFAEASHTLDRTGSVMELSNKFAELSDELANMRPLRVPSATLASRVRGFGVYDELNKDEGVFKRLATRQHQVIVYAEIDNFTHREMSRDGKQGFSVDMGVDLQLFHTGTDGDLLVWRMPEQELKDFSLNKRRDFYFTQKITLPRTLTVGGYRLKVSVRDKNNDDAVAEAIIPIDLVGDMSAIVGQR